MNEDEVNSSLQEDLNDEEGTLSDAENEVDGDQNDIEASRGRRRRLSKKQKRLENKKKIEEKKELYSAALEDMKNDKFKSARSCAKHYGLSHSALSRMIKNGTEYCTQGRKLSEFTEEEELRICQHITKMLELGFGLTTSELLPLFQELMSSLLEADKNRTTKWKDNMPPYNFVYNFTLRHCLVLRSSMEISKARSIITPESLKLWQRDTEIGKFVNLTLDHDTF